MLNQIKYNTWGLLAPPLTVISDAMQDYVEGFGKRQRTGNHQATLARPSLLPARSQSWPWSAGHSHGTLQDVMFWLSVEPNLEVVHQPLQNNGPLILSPLNLFHSEQVLLESQSCMHVISRCPNKVSQLKSACGRAHWKTKPCMRAGLFHCQIPQPATDKANIWAKVWQKKSLDCS